MAGVTSTWVPPTETGLEHSAAIADSAAVAIGGGKASGGGGVQRVFKSVGAFDGDKNNVATLAEGTSTLKVTYVLRSAACYGSKKTRPMIVMSLMETTNVDTHRSASMIAGVENLTTSVDVENKLEAYP